MFIFIWVSIQFVLLFKCILMLNVKNGWDIVIGVFSIATGVAAAWIAIKEYKVTSKNDNIERFKLTDKFLGSNYVLLSQRALEIYRNIYPSSEFKKNNDQLVHKPGWFMDISKGLKSVDEITLEFDEVESKDVGEKGKMSAESQISKLLPDNELSYVETSLLFTNKDLWDAPTYIVKDVNIEDNGKPKISLSNSMYYEFYNSCMSYGHLQANANIDKRAENKIKKIRQENDIFDFSNRLCGIGVVTLTVLKGLPGLPKMILQYRASNLAEGRGLLNAVPAGSLQPYSSDPETNKKEIKHAVKVNILREMGEELLGRREFSDCYNIETMETNAFAKFMRKSLYFLGIGFNPLNTYLEVITLATIDFSKSDARDFFYSRTDNRKSSEICRRWRPPKRNKDIKALFSPNYEGKLEILDFTKENLAYISNLYNAAPALRQICKILEKNYEYIIENYIAKP